MPLPNPDYLLPEYFNWDKSQHDAVLVFADTAVLGSQRVLRWDACDAYDRRTVHNLIMGYATRAGVIEANAVTAFPAWNAFHVMYYGDTLVGANNAGLETGITYTASMVVNGVEDVISIVGVATDTIDNVITKINAQMILIGATGQVIWSPAGNIELISNTLGAGQIVEIFDGNLFSSIT